MKITTKEVRTAVRLLDEIIKEYKEEHPSKKRNWKTYEHQHAERVATAFRELKPFAQKAVASLQTTRSSERGRKRKLSLEQKVLVLLLKHLVKKSNRDMAHMLILFSLLTDVSVSYKSIERLYSDHEVQLAIHNLHMLILQKKNITTTDSSGDGTGYAISVRQHYSSEAQKLKQAIKKSSQQRKQSKRKKYIYSFNIIDLKSRLYLGCGTSFKSEKEAFLKATDMVQQTRITMKSLRLDRYYSGQTTITFCRNKFENTKVYLIPKKNATIKGSWEWKRMLHAFLHTTKPYLQEYYKRNQSESAFSEDKRRTGWAIAQRKVERVDTANTLTMLWHNLYWLAPI